MRIRYIYVECAHASEDPTEGLDKKAGEEW